jgi:rod shape-determining protein MreB
VEAVRELFRHLLRLVGVNGKVEAENVRAVVGVPAAALRTNKQYLRNAMKGIVDSLLIVSEPFAVAYGLDALLHTMIIDIGAGTTDFCVMKGRYPTEEDQRTLTVAGDSIDTQLLKLVQERYPSANVTVFMVREWKENHSFVGDAPGPVIVQAPVKGVPTDLDITAELKAACESVSRRRSRRCSTCCRAWSRSSRSACATTSSFPAAVASSAACPRRSRPH